MRKSLTAVTLGCVFALAMSVAASACNYQTQAQSNADKSDQTAQAQPASSQN